MTSPRIVFLHGLEGSPEGFKATHLREAFGADRVITPDMRDLPFDARLVRALVAVRESGATADEKVVVVGSSLGGWLAGIVAAVMPANVANLLLLVPAFRDADIPTSAECKDKLRQLVPDAAATLGGANVAECLPAMPTVACPTTVIIATDDAVVSEARIQQWLAQTPTATAERWPADHLLTGHMDKIIDRVRACLAAIEK